MSLCHWRPSCENSPAYVFAHETASSPFCPIFSKGVIFLHDGSGPAGKSSQSSDLYCRQSQGRVIGGQCVRTRGEGRWEVPVAQDSKKGEMCKGFLLIRPSVVQAVKACMYGSESLGES